jgi:hypothetical protein
MLPLSIAGFAVAALGVPRLPVLPLVFLTGIKGERGRPLALSAGDMAALRWVLLLPSCMFANARSRSTESQQMAAHSHVIGEKRSKQENSKVSKVLQSYTACLCSNRKCHRASVG